MSTIIFLRGLEELLASRDLFACIDVRERGEFASAQARFLDKQRPIVTLCDTGARSTLAAETLRSLGCRNVRVLEGGIEEWQAQGGATEDGIEGTGVSAEHAQADFGHTVWEGALGKSRADMERYLSWEIDLVKD